MGKRPHPKAEAGLRLEERETTRMVGTGCGVWGEPEEEADDGESLSNDHGHALLLQSKRPFQRTHCWPRHTIRR